MSDTLTTGQVAGELGTTAPTVRSLLERGLLTGRQEHRGTRFVWLVDASSVRTYLAKHGEFSRRPRQSRLGKLEDEVAALAAVINTTNRREAPSTSRTAVERERDDLRATVVTLRETLARVHSVAELQREADAERSAIIEHLQAAVAAGERADVLRRRASGELEEALAAASRPGHLGVARLG
jgi:hypothetical protein